MSLARSKYDSRNQLYEMGTAPIQRKMFGNSLMCVFNKKCIRVQIISHLPISSEKIRPLNLSSVSIRRIFPITLNCLHLFCTSLAYLLHIEG